MQMYLKKLREDLDFDTFDAWQAEKPPRYKGCEPMITGNEPVKCNHNKQEDNLFFEWK